MLLATVAGCSDGGGNRGNRTSAAQIGPAGGTVLGPNGASVIVPAGALTQDTTIAIAQANAGAPALAPNFAAAGFMYAFTPHGQNFALPVTISVPFDPAQLPAGASVALIKTANGAAGPWEEVAGATVIGNTLQAQVTGFSFVAAISLPSKTLLLMPGETDEVEVDKNFTQLLGLDFPEAEARIAVDGGAACNGLALDNCERRQVTASVSAMPAGYRLRFTDPVPFLTVPVSVFPATPVATAPAVRITTGEVHTLALLADGSIWFWGSSGSDASLDSVVNAVPATVPRGYVAGEPIPKRVNMPSLPAGTAWTDVAAGYFHSLALRSDGTVWAWGGNPDGELGDGTTTDRSVPVQVPFPGVVTAIAAGRFHSLALLNDGSVRTWGWPGATGPVPTPTPVPNLANVTAVAASWGFSLARRSDGTVWAWGSNINGQLGATTSETCNGVAGTSCSSVPVQVQNLDDVIAIAAGGSHSLAVRGDGTVWAWGYNAAGQLGDGTTVSRSTPAQVTNLGNVTAVAAGQNHSLALRNDGSVWAWGRALSGQLGAPAGLQAETPVAVQNLDNAVAIAAGGWHSLALLGDCTIGGTLRAWGANTAHARVSSVRPGLQTGFWGGQLGDGTFRDKGRPVPVLGIGAAGSCGATVRLTAYISGSGDGTLASTAPGLECERGLCWQDLPLNAGVTLTAGAFAPARFDDWRWDCASAANAVSLVMDGPKLCKLRFRRDALPAPRNVRASAGATSVTLSWDPVALADSYNVYWNTTGNVTNTDNAIRGVTSPRIHPGRTVGTTYYYIVTAVRGGSESAPSAEVAAAPTGGPFTLSVTMLLGNHQGTFVRTTDGSLNCVGNTGACTVQYPAGTVVTIEAGGDFATIEAWNGDCPGFTPGDGGFSITMNRDFSCTAVYTTAPFP